MASISLRSVSKYFGDFAAVNDVNLEIPDKEFVVLLGPSGCGKSTLLRVLAGLADASEGRIEIGGRPVDGLGPRERDLAFVFQSYALYPHMTVRRNIGFPLMMDRFRWWYHLPIFGIIMKRILMRQPDIRSGVAVIAKTLEIEDLLDRYPRTLSGGQRQRVAVGRAMVRNPAAFLMDEPLSNLDAKLRVHMRSQIVQLHRRVNATFVYVTHDQTEAMTMGTRIVVLRDGVVQQYDTPRQIFDFPANTFVARFIGSPPMNVLPLRIKSEDLGNCFGVDLRLPDRLGAVVRYHGLVGEGVLLGLRPEMLSIVDKAGPNVLSARVSVVEELGSETLFGLDFGDGHESHLLEEETDDKVFARQSGNHSLKVGIRVGVDLSLEGACLFKQSSGSRLVHPAEVDALKSDSALSSTAETGA